MENEERFSDDPEEQMRIENELLKLKMQAEHGAQFGGNMSNIPPEVEQEFLKQILAFQEQQKDAPMVVFREYLESPELPLSNELSEEELIIAWDKLEELLEEKHIQLHFNNEDLPIAAQYDFVVKDLFPLTIMQPSAGHGWIFDYEEFYPDHALDMGRRTEEFMKDFFANTITPDSWYLANELVNTQAQITVDKAGLVAKVQRFHDLFQGIKSYEYNITNTSFTDAKNPGELTMGFVEGDVKYVIERDDREEQEVAGPFKLYFQKSIDWWEIFGFHVHGFSWE